MKPAARPYSDYRRTNSAFLAEIPVHWDLKPLKQLASVQLSNVDKLSEEGEQPVSLCNYVDVYKHDFIRAGHPFMQATAKPIEIERFELCQGDVLITKDSETWDDIGVPALITEDLPGVLCGYHLAMLRPHSTALDGSFLYWALESRMAALQFHAAATGVTRFGISKADIKNVVIPVPPFAEQLGIAKYSSHAQRQVARLIRNKRRLIALLNEEKQAIIQQAVTRGLDPDVPMKPSGVEWLGEIPAHWEIRRGKFFMQETDERSEDGFEELLSVSHLTGVTPRSAKTVTMFKAESYAGHKLVRSKDIAVNTMWAWMAALGVSQHAGLVSPSYATYRQFEPTQFEDRFLDLLLRTPLYRGIYHSRSTGIRSSRLRLYPDEFLDIRFPIPPRVEQIHILKEIDARTRQLNTAISNAQNEIDLIREYRTRLIADVVTGQLDVRETAASLPDVEDTEVDPLLIDADDLELEEGDDLPDEALDLSESADAAD